LVETSKNKTHSTLIAKIGDWGSARATLSGSRTMTHGVGTACWLAPEVIKHARSSKYSDVYGYGIILWEMGTRKEVYEGLESTQIIAMVANEGLRPPVPEDCPWKDVMVKCWAENPQDRLGFNKVVVELNRISKKLDEKNKIENDIAIAQLEEQERERKRQQEHEGTNAEEETPLIEANITSSIRSKSRIFSNILRQRKGE
jgi:serine/threonine protein kinase